jgi:DNA-binding transcriptional MerR regulator
MTYRVEELAAAAGIRVDTVRFYQSKRLLPPPQRLQRAAVYSDQHLSVLRRIRRYQSQGLNLAVIKRLLSARPHSRGDALLAAVVEHSGERSLTRTQLAALSGVVEPLLASLEAARLLEPTMADGEPRYGEAELQMVRAGLEILQQGFPLDELLRVAIEHAERVRQSVDDAIALFDRHVRKAGKGTTAPADVTEAFRRLLPSATMLVALHFQRTLLNRALERLRQRGDRESLEAAAAVLRSGHLEVKWS